MRRVLLIVALTALMQTARTFSVAGVGVTAGTAMAFGFVLLTAYLVGTLFADARLPRLTGYLVTGIVAGPAGLDLVSSTALDNLQIFNGVATALIALTAGSELDLARLRPLFPVIRGVSVLAVGGTAVLLSAGAWVVRAWIPFLAALDGPAAVAVCAVLGITMVANSPAVVVALQGELGSDGPVARTVLGVVVIADLIVILLFGVVSPLARTLLGGTADLLPAVGSLAYEILGSLASGAVLGVIVGTYLRFARGNAAMFLLAVAFVVAEVGRRVHFDPLIVALATGLVVRNAGPSGERLRRDVESSSLPVYVVFFAVAGASLHLEVLARVLLPALFFVGLRAAGLLAGARLGAGLAGAQPTVRRYAGFGLLPQAGLALALALLFRDTFPEFGPDATALVLGVVALNELFMPALYRWALVRSGEADAVALPARTARAA